jgi:hypothetical protein
MQKCWAFLRHLLVSANYAKMLGFPAPFTSLSKLCKNVGPMVSQFSTFCGIKFFLKKETSILYTSLLLVGHTHLTNPQVDVFVVPFHV